MSQSHYDLNTVPSLEEEFSETIRGLITDGEPSTVTHALLLDQGDPYTKEGIAAAIGQPTSKIEGILAALQEHGWL